MNACGAWMRDLVWRSPLLWSLRTRLNRTYEQTVPTDSTEVFVTGVWRSGNTFARFVMKRLFPSLRFASHGHVIATLKVAKRRGVKTVVLIREPLDVTASACVKRTSLYGGLTDKHIDYLLSHYIRYYAYVADNKEAFRILTFETLTQRPEVLANILAEWGVVQPIETEDVRKAADDVLEGLKNADKPAIEREAPSEEKALLKQEAVERIQANDKLADAQRLYENIVSAEDVA